MIERITEMLHTANAEQLRIIYQFVSAILSKRKD